MKKLLLFSLMIAMLVACNKSKNGETVFTNDLENVKMWNKAPNVVKGIAHSGVYACKLDTANEFSYGFCSLLGDVSTKMPKNIEVSVWAYSQIVNPDACIVIEIFNNEQKVFWKNSGLNAITKAKEWTEVKAHFDLPSNLNPKNEVRVYIWNPKKLEFYADDFKISFK